MRMLIALAAALLVSGAPPQESAKVVVHEWGTFTSVAGADGASLDWRPLAGPSDLPSFVYTPGNSPRGLRHGRNVKFCDGCTAGKECDAKGCIQGTVRM